MKQFVSILLICLIIRLVFFYFFPTPWHVGDAVHFNADLLQEPIVIGNTQEFSLHLGSFWHSQEVEIITSSDKDFSYGQRLTVNGILVSKVLKNKRVILAIQNPQIEAKNSGFLPIFGYLRAKIISFCENNFSQPYSGLLVGIIFGIKSLLTQQITVSFRITGLSHIVAASGMNITLITGFLITFLGSFLSRRKAIGISVVFICLYVCLSGFDASIIRAALMGILAISASLSGRQYSGVYMLFLVGLGMLLWNPLLLTDVGFQLSVLATAGILLLKPVLFSSNFLGDEFGTTLAAQVATLPVLLVTFGQYSLLSIIANLLVLWTIPLIMTIGGVGVMVGLLFEPLGRLVVWLCIPLLWFMVQVITFFSTHAVLVQISSVPIFFITGYYLLIGSIIFLKNRSKSLV